MDIDYSIFNHLSCYEEFEIKSSIYGIDKKEILKHLSNEYNTYDNKIYLVLGGHLIWFDLDTGEKTDAPKIIKGDFDCSFIHLTSLKGCPREIRGDFDCSYNQLTSLKGCPKKVKGNFICNHNQLTSLKGCAKEVEGDFYCYNNQLTSLDGCPKIIKGDFDCYDNKLKNLDDLTTKIKGKIYSDFK